MEHYIKGMFKQFIYRNEKGYVIGLFKINDTDLDNMKDYINRTITITGYFADIGENENYYLKGEEVVHPKYGFQFNVSEYERIKPDDIDGIVEFLSSDLFKGIGEKMAKRIVDCLGTDTLNLIIKDKTCLDIVPKLNVKKRDLIYETLIKYEESHETIVKLTEIGFSLRESLALYNIYKGNTWIIINNNPYLIMDDNLEISFTKLDNIALQIGIDKLDDKRICACVIHVMKDVSFKCGDTYLFKEEIYNALTNYLNFDLDSDMFDNCLWSLESERKIIIADDKYYLPNYYDAENVVADRVKYLINKDLIKVDNLDIEISKLENNLNINYNDEQKIAIKKAMENNILIITGGPGTGKTTIVKAIVELYRQMHNYTLDELIANIALLAPTGRASKRMSESTGLPATTIHRFLKWDKEANTFCVNEYDPDYSKLIIVDEVSMIDIELMSSLLKGLTKNIQLIMVGDVDQLPSVAPGMVLSDLIDSDMIDVVRLNMLYRQSDNSYIPLLAQNIRNDEIDETVLEKKDDYQFLVCQDNLIQTNIVKIVKQIIDADYDYQRVQLMAPMYANRNGIDILNKILQAEFNPKSDDKNELKIGDVTYRENDKVLQLVNNPDENVYNGDIGVIKMIKTTLTKSGKPEVLIDFDGNLVNYKQKDLINIKHAYIISIHKSQGSEFEFVIMPISMDYSRMLYKKLIYTGITRAKRKLILIGNPQAFYLAVNNNSFHQRKTTLLQKLV